MQIQQSIIDQINLHHSNAIRQAENAVESAKNAGKLLLEAKATLPHGAWTEWLKNHVDVSERQAQRYMAAAKAKKTNIFSITTKNDAMSDLKSFKSKGIWKNGIWIPEAGCMYIFNEDDAVYWVQPSTEGGLWFHVCKHYRGKRMSTDGFYRHWTIFSRVTDPDFTSQYYVGTTNHLGYIGVEEVLKSYGLKNLQESLKFGKRVDCGFERPFGEPENKDWYWGNDGSWDDRKAYAEALLKELQTTLDN
jgi:hypothetical protein